MFIKNEDENVILETSPSIKSFFNLINLLIFLLIIWNIYQYLTINYYRITNPNLNDAAGWALILIIRGVYAYIKSNYYLYIITNKRVVKVDGLITRKTNEIPLSSIETINFKEGLIERFLNLGTVILTKRSF